MSTEQENQKVIHEGYIIGSYMKGFYVQVSFDKDSGGYYIYFLKNIDDKNAERYDEWYPDIETVRSRLTDMEVEWND